MPWQLSGQIIESCSCNMMCPCWYTVPELAIQDQGYCASAIAFRIGQGHADGVPLDGRTVVLAIDFPELMFNGGGTARVYIGQDASADQRRALEAIFQGSQGGPMSIVGGLVSNWLPTETVPIALQEDGDSITVTVGNFGEVRSQRMRDAGGQGFTLQGGGFVAALGMTVAELSPSSSHWTDAAMPRQFDTKSGARGAITWSG
jgi:hypothetical protein